MKGVVKSFSRLKGYGFIQSEELEHEVFVHYTNIDDMDGFKTLSINDKVEFNYDKTIREQSMSQKENDTKE